MVVMGGFMAPRPEMAPAFPWSTSADAPADSSPRWHAAAFLRRRCKGQRMTPVFDLLRLSLISMDVVAAQRSGRVGIAQRQRNRLAQMLDNALRGSRFTRSTWAPGPAPVRSCRICRWSRAVSSWSASMTG